MKLMHEIHVRVVSAEEADYGVAEFWCDGRQIAYTVMDDGDLMLRIDKGVEVGAHSRAVAFAAATRLLSLY
jgi:aconitase B